MQRITPRTQCAGQRCPESEGCARYAMRVQGAPWASFDVERMRFESPCLHRIDLIHKESAIGRPHSQQE
jgi:hypothetical protein